MDLKPLDAKDIEQAMLNIKEMHPIYDTKFEVAFPWIGHFFTLGAWVLTMFMIPLKAFYFCIICRDRRVNK